MMGISEGEGRKKRAESAFKEIIGENFPKLGRNWKYKFTNLKTPYYLNTKRPPRHIILKLSKVNDKQRVLKAVGGVETETYKCSPVRLSADFSAETLRNSGQEGVE